MKLKFQNTISGIAIAEQEFTETQISRAFGRSLRALRTYKKLSLNALSEETDIPNPTINRYENGINIPTITQAIKLTDYFGVTIEEMIVFGVIDECGEKIVNLCQERENQ